MEKKTTKTTKATKAKKVTKTTNNKEKDAFNNRMRLFNLYFFQYIIYSFIIFVVGLIIFLEPAMATRTAEIITAACLIMVGLGSGFDYAIKKKIDLFDFDLVHGAIALILAVLILTNPFALTEFLAVAFGVFLIVSGLLKINFALKFRDINEASWVLVTTMSVISIVFGITVIVNPFANLYFTQVIGLFMILYAVIEGTYIILLKQRSKFFLKQIK